MILHLLTHCIGISSANSSAIVIISNIYCRLTRAILSSLHVVFHVVFRTLCGKRCYFQGWIDGAASLGIPPKVIKMIGGNVRP